MAANRCQQPTRHNNAAAPEPSALPLGDHLTEVLAVIVAICVLIAIALPWIQRARERLRLEQCSKRLHDIGIALMNYEDKHRYLTLENLLHVSIQT